MKSKLLVAIVLAACVSSASPVTASTFREAIKRVLPHVGEQVREIARQGKVIVTAACVAAVCALNFAAPSTADLNDLRSDAELINSSDASSIFAAHDRLVEKSTRARNKVSFEHWLSKGIYHSDGDNLGTLRYGITAKYGSLNVYGDDCLFVTILSMTASTTSPSRHVLGVVCRAC